MIIQREDPGLRCRVRCVDVKQFNNVRGIFNKTAADWLGESGLILILVIVLDYTSQSNIAPH